MITDLLKDRIAVVTGGTRGIGLAIVRTFLEQGAKVILFGSRPETVEATLSTLRSENPAWTVRGSSPKLSEPESVKSAINSVIDEFGRIDILVNNAGISARDSIYDYSEDEFDKIMELNVKSVFVCTQVVAPFMKKNGGGSIINTSSMVGTYGQARGCGYPASKFAVNGLTKSLALELAPDQIRVNAVAPGVTNTDMVKNLPTELVQQISASIPLGRPAEPNEIANAFLFLASDLSSYVTGSILAVDGGSKG